MPVALRYPAQTTPLSEDLAWIDGALATLLVDYGDSQLWWQAATGGPSTITGVAIGAFGFTSPAAGTREATGVATGALGFTGPVAGTRQVAGVAAGDLGFTGPASGFSSGGVATITGVATGAFGFTGPAVGLRSVFGAAAGLFGFAGPIVLAGAVAAKPIKATYREWIERPMRGTYRGSP